MSDSQDTKVKVLFRVPNGDGSAEVETLWATPLGGDNYQLENSPFWAYGVSWQDIVRAPFAAEEGLPSFSAVVSKSGHRTVRVAFDPPIEDGNESDNILQGLITLGCSYEGANKKYLAINIPPEVKLEDVRTYLIEQVATWEHADPSYAELYPAGNS